MFSRILIALDGSPLAEKMLPYASGLAGALSVPIQLLRVIDPAGLGPRDRGGEGDHLWAEELAASNSGQSPVAWDRHHEAYLDQEVAQQELLARHYLDVIAGPLRAAGLVVETAVPVGPVTRMIGAVAETNGGALMAMATHGRSGLLGIALGSVAREVLERGAAPVLLLRPGHGSVVPWAPPRSVIVPLDGSAMAERALPLAGDLARALEAPLFLTRAVSLYQMIPPVPLMGTGAYIPVEIEERARNYMDGQVAMLRAGGRAVDAAVVEGDPGSELRKLAAEGSGLVVMATHARAGMALAVMGSVASEVVTGSGAPVLLLKG